MSEKKANCNVTACDTEHDSFIFVSYAHQDSAIVFPIIERVHERGYAIWYDKGITVSSTWTDEIAIAITKCKAFLLFVSKHSVSSPYVRAEIEFAFNQQIKIIPVYLDSKTILPPGLALGLNATQGVMDIDSPQLVTEQICKALEHNKVRKDEPTAPMKNREEPPVKKRPSFLYLGASALAALLVLLLLWFLPLSSDTLENAESGQGAKPVEVAVGNPKPPENPAESPLRAAPDFGGNSKVFREAEGIGSTPELAALAALRSAVAQVNGARIAAGQWQDTRTVFAGFDDGNPCVTADAKEAANRVERFSRHLTSISQGMVLGYEVLAQEEIEKPGNDEINVHVRVSQDISQEPAAVRQNAPRASSPDAPVWIQLLPAGVFSGRDSRGPFETDIAAILSRFKHSGGNLVVDYEHASEERGARFQAAGWVRNMQARSDGLWGKIEWTERARAMIEKKEYRYVSPTIISEPGGRATGGRVVGIKSVALTKNPYLFIREFDLKPGTSGRDAGGAKKEQDIMQGKHQSCDYDLSRKTARDYWKVRIRAEIAQYRAPEEKGRPRIVVALPRTLAGGYPVGGASVPANEVARAIRSRLSDTLVQTGRFIVLDREFGDALDAEIAHINSGKVRAEDSARLGQQLAADLILIPTLERFEYRRHARQLRMSDRQLVSWSGGGRIALRLIHAATGEIVLSDSFEHQLPATGSSTLPFAVDGKGMADTMMDALSGQIGETVVTRAFPISVIALTGNQAVLSQGGEILRAGQRWQAVLLGEELTDPQTGLSLGRNESPCCTVRIDRVSAQTAHGILEDASALEGIAFRPGMIELRQQLAAAKPIASAAVPATRPRADKATPAAKPEDPDW